MRGRVAARLAARLGAERGGGAHRRIAGLEPQELVLARLEHGRRGAGEQRLQRPRERRRQRRLLDRRGAVYIELRCIVERLGEHGGDTGAPQRTPKMGHLVAVRAPYGRHVWQWRWQWRRTLEKISRRAFEEITRWAREEHEGDGTLLGVGAPGHLHERRREHGE